MKVPNGEKISEKAERLLLLEPAKQELVTAEVGPPRWLLSTNFFARGLRKILNYNGIASWKTCTPKIHGRI